MAIALSKFFPMILPHVPGVPDPTVEMYLRRSLINFCNLSMCITETLDPVEVPAGSTETDVDISNSEEVVSIAFAYADGVPLDPVSELQLSTDVGPWKSKTGTPTHFLANKSTLRLYPIPTTNVVIDMTIAKRPSINAGSVDDALFMEWAEPIVSGTLAKILIVPGQPYSNPQLASAHLALFNDGVIGAQAKVFKQTNYAPLRVQPV